MTLTHRLTLLLGLSLTLSFFSWGKKILFPLQIFTTWVHECCHAVTALILGGESIRITIAPDGSGLTHYRITKGRIPQAIIASAGYLGSSLIGCFIFYFTVRTEKLSDFWDVHFLVISICAWIACSLIFWIRNVFGWVSVLLLGLAFASLDYPPMNQYSKEVLIFLSIQTSLNALFDLRTLLSAGSGKKNMSDAHILQKLLYLPHWCWTIAWLGLSLLMMYWTVLKTV